MKKNEEYGALKSLCSRTGIWAHNVPHVGFNVISKKLVVLLALVLTVLLLSSLNVHAQSVYYVRAGASGSGNGSDWNNAYSSLPATLIRGATYYIAGGSYGSRTFNTPSSGSTYIYIKKAVAADHGTDTGWQASYGTAQATFTSWTFGSGYWDIDGQTGGGPSSWTSGHGIKVGSSTTGNVVYNSRNYAGMPHLVFKHVEFTANATGPNTSRAFDLVAVDGLTLSYTYIHDIGCDVFYVADVDNFTIEYSKIARNYQNASCHGDLVEHYGGSNMVVRYNIIEDTVGSYMFGNHDGGVNGLKVYGNLMTWPTVTPFFGNGLVGCLNSTPSGYVSNLEFYNNTISGPFSGNTQIAFYTLRGSNNSARNNIWHQSGSGSSYIFSFDNATHSNNTLYNMTTVSGEQNLTGNPFVNRSGGDYNLLAASTAGYSLSSSYNTDMNGNTRGSDGTWDRGALEYGGASNPTAPSAPAGLRVVQ